MEGRSNVRSTSRGDVAHVAREAKGWTREQVAVLANCSVSLIARFEIEPDYTSQAAMRICRLLDADPVDVFVEVSD